MPPKKEVKEKQVKGDEAEDVVLQYMKSVNRPYSSTDVSANLKGKVSKPVAQKVLTDLAEKGLLTVKAYGKQTIFVYNQNPCDTQSRLNTASSDDLAELEEELKRTQKDLEERRNDLKTVSREVAAKLALSKTKDLVAEIQRVNNENDVTLKALLPFRGQDVGTAKVDPLSDAETKQIDQDFVKWRKQWVDRRKVYKELLGMLIDAGQILDTPSFEDDQGINADDEEAKEIENGEFCKPPQIIRKPVAKAITSVFGAKRSSSSSSSQEAAKKKLKKGKV